MLAIVCDKDKKRSRCGYVVGVSTCTHCGKQYERCADHGAQAGADRSLRAHLTMGCPVLGLRKDRF